MAYLPQFVDARSLMMTSSNGNIFRVTGHLCGEFTGLRWIPRTKASDAELWYFLWSASLSHCAIVAERCNMASNIMVIIGSGNATATHDRLAITRTNADTLTPEDKR